MRASVAEEWNEEEEKEKKAAGTDKLLSLNLAAVELDEIKHVANNHQMDELEKAMKK